jgi:tetratricopeptide (TPR) repeat protein
MHPVLAVLTETISPVLSTTLTAVLRDQQSGQFHQARQRLRRFLTQYPKHPVATAALADLYMREVQLYQLNHMALPKQDSQERQAVYALLQDAHARYPDHPRLLSAWERWQRVFFVDKTVTGRLWQDSYQPGHLTQYQAWANRLMASGRLADAKQIALVALELGPTHPQNYLAVSELLLATDHVPEAQRFAQQAELLGIERPTPPDRWLALKAKLQEAQMDSLSSDRFVTENPNAQAVSDILQVLHTKKLAVNLAELHDVLGMARREADVAKVWEAITSLGIHLQRSGKPVNPALWRQYQQELAQIQAQPLAYPETFALSAERLKQVIGQNPNYTPFFQSQDDFIAGQALFLASDIAKANERLDAVDGASPEGYQAVADILLLQHAFVMADTMAHRGLQMGELPSLRATMQAIALQRQLAQKAITYGDVDTQRKDWPSAQKQYLQASLLNPEWETPYLRMGELYVKWKKPADAYNQYHKAVTISPSLLTSPAFSKKYQKLAAKTGHSVNTAH